MIDSQGWKELLLLSRETHCRKSWGLLLRQHEKKSWLWYISVVLGDNNESETKAQIGIIQGLFNWLEELVQPISPRLNWQQRMRGAIRRNYVWQVQSLLEDQKATMNGKNSSKEFAQLHVYLQLYGSRRRFQIIDALDEFVDSPSH